MEQMREIMHRLILWACVWSDSSLKKVHRVIHVYSSMSAIINGTYSCPMATRVEHNNIIWHLRSFPFFCYWICWVLISSWCIHVAVHRQFLLKCLWKVARKRGRKPRSINTCPFAWYLLLFTSICSWFIHKYKSHLYVYINLAPHGV